MSNFLPDKYEIPQKSDNYMRFQDGENKFRILSSPIIGWEGWKTQSDGSHKPIRVPMDGKLVMDDIDDEEQIKHFWAMPVFNYKEEKIQILKITQKGIQKSLKALAKSADWGSPLEYDILVTKSGQKLETEYQVNPVPPKPLDKALEQLYKDTPINLEALYTGGDPFADKSVDVDPNDIPDNL